MSENYHIIFNKLYRLFEMELPIDCLKYITNDDEYITGLISKIEIIYKDFIKEKLNEILE